MYTPLKKFVLYRNNIGKVVLPNMNFTNTQFETVDTQYIFTYKGKYPISHKIL